jgi:hypothetical protein
MNEAAPTGEKFVNKMAIFRTNSERGSVKVLYSGDTVTIDTCDDGIDDIHEISRLEAIETVNQLIIEQEKAIHELNESILLMQRQIENGRTMVAALEVAPDFKPKGLATPFEDLDLQS